MKNKWSPKKVKALQEWLRFRWPDRFSVRSDQAPFSLSIHKEILKHRAENPELSSRLLSEALKRQVTSYGYLYGMLKNTHRYDLAGNKTEKISDEHRHWARATLRSNQKVAQKIRREKEKKLRAESAKGAKRPMAKPLAANQDQDSVASGKAAKPVIRYRQARRKYVPVSPVDVAR